MSTRTRADLTAFATALTLLLAGSAPADAALRLGVDGIWVPAAADHVEAGGGTNMSSDHSFGSFGAAGHLFLGPDFFAAGPKVNYLNEGLAVDGSTERRDEFDINAAVRIGIPKIGLAILGEIGPSFSTNYEGIGFNAGVGGEYLFNLGPAFQLGPGIEGQYVQLPAEINGESTNSEIGRLMVTLNIDFSP